MSGIWDKIQGMAENAPEAGFAAVNFGKLTVTPLVVSWATETKDGAEIRVANKRPLAENEELAEGQQMEFLFSVDISEFNPALTWAYERSVPVKRSGVKVKTDWSEIVLPSIISVFGEKWAEKFAKQPYVCIEDVENFNGNTSKKSGKVLLIPKFVALYKNKAECLAAREKRFPKREEAGVAETTEIPAIVITSTKALIESIGEDAARKALANHPFGDYDPDTLIALAKA